MREMQSKQMREPIFSQIDVQLYHGKPNQNCLPTFHKDR